MNYVCQEIRHHVECTLEEFRGICLTHEFELDDAKYTVNPLGVILDESTGMCKVQLQQLGGAK